MIVNKESYDCIVTVLETFRFRGREIRSREETELIFNSAQSTSPSLNASMKFSVKQSLRSVSALYLSIFPPNVYSASELPPRLPSSWRKFPRRFSLGKVIYIKTVLMANDSWCRCS